MKNFNIPKKENSDFEVVEYSSNLDFSRLKNQTSQVENNISYNEVPNKPVKVKKVFSLLKSKKPTSFEEIAEEIDYDDNKYGKYHYKKPINKKLLFTILGGISGTVLLVFAVILIINLVKVGTLLDISTNFPDVIYVGETVEVKVNTIGTGKLSSTKTNFSVSNNNIVRLEDKQIKGSSVINRLEAINTGKFTLTINSNLRDQKLEKKEKTIVICKRLKDNGLTPNMAINVGNGVTTNAPISLGEEEICQKDVTYTISDITVATVDANGKITGKKLGKTTLTIKDKTDSFDIIINVINTQVVNAESISLNKQTAIMEEGTEEALIVAFTPANTTNKTVTFKSSNNSVVSVNNLGIIKTLKPGTAIITATSQDGNKISTMTVTVTEKFNAAAPAKVNTLTMASTNQINNLYAKTGDKITVKVTFNQTVTKPVIKIAGQVATVSGSEKDYTGEITISNTSFEGAASVNVSGFTGVNNLEGTSFSSITSGDRIIIDRTIPTCKLTLKDKTLTISGTDKNAVNGYLIDQSETTIIGFTKETKLVITDTTLVYYGHVIDKAGNIGHCKQ